MARGPFSLAGHVQNYGAVTNKTAFAAKPAENLTFPHQNVTIAAQYAIGRVESQRQQEPAGGDRSSAFSLTPPTGS
jgi:hypothetical protein